MPRVLVQSDNFDRASLGADWSQQNTGLAGNVIIDSSIRVTGQFATQPTDQLPTIRWVGAGTFTADQYSSLRLLNVAGLGGAQTRYAVAVRSSGSGTTKAYYELTVRAEISPMTTELAVWTSGTNRTVLHTGTVAWANGDLLSLEIEGTTLTAMRNGVALGGGFTRTDATLSSGAPGFSVTQAALADDWEGGNITAGGGDTTPPVITGPGGAAGPTATASIVAPATAVHTYTANEAVIWSISGGANAALFSIGSASGVLAFQAAPAAGTYVVDVRGTDAANNPTTQTLTVTVTASGVAPAVTQNPANVSVSAGQVASFTAAFSGSPAPTLQWRRNGANIPGATSSTYTFFTVLGDSGATFDCVGTNATGSATTTAATLTVTAAASFSMSFPDGVAADYTGSVKRLSQAWTGYATPWNPSNPAAVASATRTTISGTSGANGAITVSGLPSTGLWLARVFFGSGASVAEYSLPGTAS